MLSILRLSRGEAEREQGQLVDLLIDAVESGASIGFMPPLSRPDAEEYWRSVYEAMNDGSRVLLVASDGGKIQGAMQIALEMRTNGNHRAEFMKLFVHRRARRLGIAKALMKEAETVARSLGRTLVFMDTRKGGEAERLCESLGYTRFGEVPNYARSANGELHTTVFFYQQLL
jgi:acetyltransferase